MYSIVVDIMLYILHFRIRHISVFKILNFSKVNVRVGYFKKINALKLYNTDKEGMLQ